MKLQFLGDSRDSFKWDLLHYAVTGADPKFERLVFVPMLTPDESGLPHGGTPAARFPCRPAILTFVEGLRTGPRQLERVSGLGSIEGLRKFAVDVFEPNRELGFGWARAKYWRDLMSRKFGNDLVFLDPDNGFESASTAGRQHVRFGEVDSLLRSLPPTSALCVFQYRPQGQSWETVFGRIESGLPSETSAHAIHDGQLAFVFLSHAKSSERLDPVVTSYQKEHPFLHCRPRRGV